MTTIVCFNWHGISQILVMSELVLVVADLEWAESTGWFSSKQLHNRGHTSVPPCYYEKDRVFIMSKNFVRYLSMLTWDVVWDVIMQFLRFQLHIFFWNKKKNPKSLWVGGLWMKGDLLKGISVLCSQILKICSPKFPHLEAKCKPKKSK